MRTHIRLCLLLLAPALLLICHQRGKICQENPLSGRIQKSHVALPRLIWPFLCLSFSVKKGRPSHQACFDQPKIGRSHAPIAVTHECEGTPVTKNSWQSRGKNTLASLKLQQVYRTEKWMLGIRWNVFCWGLRPFFGVAILGELNEETSRSATPGSYSAWKGYQILLETASRWGPLTTISGFIPSYTHLQPRLNRVCWGYNYLITRGAPSCWWCRISTLGPFWIFNEGTWRGFSLYWRHHQIEIRRLDHDIQIWTPEFTTWKYTLPKTKQNAPANRPGPKRIVFQPSISRAICC